MKTNSNSLRTGRENDRKHWRLGPGTTIAVGAAVLLLVSGWVGREQPKINAGDIAFAADAQGRLHRVAVPSPQASLPPRPLWKPEPRLILEQGDRLNLTPEQRQQIVAIQAGWLRERRLLEKGMQNAIAGAPGSAPVGEKVVPLPALQSGLAGYSELSREYDARRFGAWEYALSVLTPGQRGQIQPDLGGVDREGKNHDR